MNERTRYRVFQRATQGVRRVGRFLSRAALISGIIAMPLVVHALPKHAGVKRDTFASLTDNSIYWRGNKITLNAGERILTMQPQGDKLFVVTNRGFHWYSPDGSRKTLPNVNIEETDRILCVRIVEEGRSVVIGTRHAASFYEFPGGILYRDRVPFREKAASCRIVPESESGDWVDGAVRRTVEFNSGFDDRTIRIKVMRLIEPKE